MGKGAGLPEGVGSGAPADPPFLHPRCGLWWLLPPADHLPPGPWPPSPLPPPGCGNRRLETGRRAGDAEGGGDGWRSGQDDAVGGRGVSCSRVGLRGTLGRQRVCPQRLRSTGGAGRVGAEGTSLAAACVLRAAGRGFQCAQRQHRAANQRPGGSFEHPHDRPCLCPPQPRRGPAGRGSPPHPVRAVLREQHVSYAHSGQPCLQGLGTQRPLPGPASAPYHFGIMARGGTLNLGPRGSQQADGEAAAPQPFPQGSSF